MAIPGKNAELMDGTDRETDNSNFIGPSVEQGSNHKKKNFV